MLTNDLLEIALLEARYAAFNAKRSLGTRDVRVTEVERAPEGVSIRTETASGNAYLNRWITLRRGGATPRWALRVDRVRRDPAGASLAILTARPREDVSAASVPVCRYASSRAVEFLRLVESTSDEELDGDVVAAKRAFYCTDQFRCFVAGDAGEPLGLATTFVRDDVAWLGNAYTFPTARRRGAHRALLDARLFDAHALGLREVYTDVVPGSDSERNVLRVGFRSVAFYVSEIRNRASSMTG